LSARTPSIVLLLKEVSYVIFPLFSSYLIYCY
jgi:hypothetical protein